MSNTLNSKYVKQDADILDDLVEAYNQGTMSALIGAGFSMNVSKQYKGWGSLLVDAYTFVHGENIEKEYYEYRQRYEEGNQSGDDTYFLTKEKYIANKIYADDLLKLVSKYIEKKGYREAIDGYIEQRTPYAVKTDDGKIELHNCNGKVEDVNESSFSVHRQLLKCKRFNNIYTTNYDNLLEFTVQNIPNSGMGKYSYNDAPICRDTDLSNYISHQNIIKIHGSLRMNREATFGFDNDSNLNYIIAQEDYDTYMQKHEAFAYLMRIAMLSGTFCLIGFSGVDPNYTSWLNWMKDIINKKEGNKPKVFLIDPDPDYKMKENTDENYCKDLYNRNHHVAILHLFDEKVIEKISQKTPEINFLSAKTEKVKPGDEKTEESKPTINELLLKLLEYIEESEKQASDDKKNEEARKELEGGDDNYITGRNYYYGDGVAKDYDVAFKYLSLSNSKEAKVLLAECYLYGRGTETNLSKAIELCDNNDKISSSVLCGIAVCYYFGTKGVQEDKAKAIEWFTKAAEKEDVTAMNMLGSIYIGGNGVEKDTNKAIEWFTKAAEKEDVTAMNMLGSIYIGGNGVEKDTNKAIEWFTKAAEQGNANAMFNLAWIYENGDGVEKDMTKAIEWYTKSAEQGDAKAMFNLGLIYQKGDGVEKDMTKAIEWYTKAAEQGDAKAMNNLALIYEKGDGVEKDMTKAIEWYTKAAEQGNASAMFNLALNYKNGDGVEKDMTKAIELYTKAAEQGHAGAMGNLAWIYEKGDGVEKDMTKAIEWYKKAAEQGDADAMNSLGCCYYYADGIEQNYPKAVELYEKAIEKGSKYAPGSLGLCYYYGNGKELNYPEAFRLFNIAAENGVAEAMYYIGLCYENGQGVEMDIAKAKEWYLKAHKEGDKKASDRLKELGFIDIDSQKE